MTLISGIAAHLAEIFASSQNSPPAIKGIRIAASVVLAVRLRAADSFAAAGAL